MTIGILGGGLAGLALKRFLPDAEVLEAEAIPGGLCRSYSKNGFWYDIGGHILFSKDPEILSLITEILGDNIVRYFRRNFILFHGRFVKYPFENGLPDLPIADRLACLYHYLRRPNARPENFGEWIIARFGRGFADRYLTPYNEKIWKTPLSEISTGWVERIPDPPLGDLIKGTLGIHTEGYRHQMYFYYPKTGGIQALVSALAGDCNGIRSNFTVRKITPSASGWTVSNGTEELHYDRIISTIPVIDLIGAIKGSPPHIIEAASGLRYNSIVVVMVGTNRLAPFKRLAVYNSQRELMFHRVCFPSFLGNQYAPNGNESMVAEITLQPSDPLLNTSDDVIVERAVQDLVRADLLHKNEIVCTDIKRVRYAYVVDTHDRKKRMETLRSFLRPQGIELCGRFAEFEYLNMDACLTRARNLAGSLR